MLTNISDITADVRLASTAKTVAITLMMHGGWLSRFQIAQRCGVHYRTISRIIARLIDLDLIVATWPEDSRVKMYRWKGENT